MADLVCKDLSMTFTNPQTGAIVNALQDINFTLKKGELLSVLGPSGCGKTTLLNIIAGFLKATDGAAVLGENVIDSPGVERGMVFQQGA
ncbi:MAG: ATP-binding cassette domain-containing protein, partial [Pseudomonadota bacterium]